MNYLWTIQSNEVINEIEKNSVYLPKMKLQNHKRPNKAYQFIMNCFNEFNQTSYEGIIFCFAKMGKNNYFNSINELYTFFLNNPGITDAFWIFTADYKILQLSYDESFNLVPIDFNDFITIMPPVKDFVSAKIIKDSIVQNNYSEPIVLPSFTQVHVPYINKNNIVNIFANFDKKRSDAEDKIITF